MLRLLSESCDAADELRAMWLVLTPEDHEATAHP